MIVVLKPEISRKEEQAVLKEIKKLGYKPHVMRGVERTVVGAIGDERTHGESHRDVLHARELAVVAHGGVGGALVAQLPLNVILY